ncbi:MAG: metal ABC transporter permease [Bacteroidales bacterium]|nr:metal ABC transporter permease [Bacteroidales bacterium]
MEIVQYSFFINAAIAITLISVVAGIVGTYIVSRRMLFITGGITHTSFGGLGLGMYMGVSPTLTALIFALASAFGIEILSRGGRVREDSAIAVFWTLGMAIGIMFVYITPGYNTGLTGFLFGDILTVTKNDLYLYAIYATFLVVISVIFRKEILYTAFDRDFAMMRGVKVGFIEYLAIIVISLAIILTVKLIGIMLLLSFLSLPQMSVEIFNKSYNKIVILSMFISVVGGLAGLILSSYINLPTGATIVFILALIYLLARGVKMVLSKKYQS